ncbi:sialin isoform X2 [Syngnathoides biaculeatus]|uniref:sialin isoform X2 n=1 Tax=Syngnathoides biaculeatus TaxID=300417 RepID=UPI002ADE4C3B|nr:sialin isoform X2 [Syngnathoides biaculeatus]
MEQPDDSRSVDAAPSNESRDDDPLIRDVPVPRRCCSARFNLAFLMFLGISVVYGLRVNLSVAMVAMVNASQPAPGLNGSCPLPAGLGNASQKLEQPDGTPQYPWDAETQGWLLGAFFFGYMCTQIPGGYLSGRYGGSRLLGLGVLVTAALTLLTPPAARRGPRWLFALRALEGLAEVTSSSSSSSENAHVHMHASPKNSCSTRMGGLLFDWGARYLFDSLIDFKASPAHLRAGQGTKASAKTMCVCVCVRQGVTIPAMMSMWARWAPPLERSQLISLSGNGANFGAFLAMPLTGFLCQALGWPAVFYLCGVAGCLWAVLWFLLVWDDPRAHRRISKEERDYIVAAVGHQGGGHGWSVPVLSMVTSVPLWAIVVTQMCSNWSFYTQLTSLPTYMSNMLHFDLKANGFLSALPYLAAWLTATLTGFVADRLIERRALSVTAVRKLFTLTGMLFPAVFLLALAYAGCSPALTVAFLTLTSATAGTSGSGVFMNQIDIAPRYAGFLLGITNTFGTVPGVVAPIVTGYFTEDHTMEGWRKVFWVSAGVNLSAAVIYTLFGSGEVQPWALPREDEEAREGRTA